MIKFNEQIEWNQAARSYDGADNPIVTEMPVPRQNDCVAGGQENWTTLHNETP